MGKGSSSDGSAEGTGERRRGHVQRAHPFALQSAASDEGADGETAAARSAQQKAKEQRQTKRSDQSGEREEGERGARHSAREMEHAAVSLHSAVESSRRLTDRAKAWVKWTAEGGEEEANRGEGGDEGVRSARGDGGWREGGRRRSG
jgi:hypothetical protein